MNRIIFTLSGNEQLGGRVTEFLQAERGEVTIRKFPDGESYVRLHSDVKGKNVIIVCTLHQPDDKFLALYFFSKTARELGAAKITLIAPYLAYMRQDKIFLTGEAMTSEHFAKLLSLCVDELITIDPHLHRRLSINEIYSIPCKVLHASELITNYIKNNIDKPLLIGPDSESSQWTAAVAATANVPFIIMQKERYGDKNVSITVPDVFKYKDYTPVLIDDIISTGHTMTETVKHLLKAGMKAPVCIGVHAVFAPGANEELNKAGVYEIVTSNTIAHASNKIDVTELIVNAINNG